MVYPYKKYKIIFTKQFKLELNEFLYKSSSQLKRSLISDKFYSKIMKSLILLQIFPERYASKVLENIIQICENSLLINISLYIKSTAIQMKYLFCISFIANKIILTNYNQITLFISNFLVCLIGSQ